MPTPGADLGFFHTKHIGEVAVGEAFDLGLTENGEGFVVGQAGMMKTRGQPAQLIFQATRRWIFVKNQGSTPDKSATSETSIPR